MCTGTEIWVDVDALPLGLRKAAMHMHLCVSTVLKNVSFEVEWRCEASKKAVREALLGRVLNQGTPSGQKLKRQGSHTPLLEALDAEDVRVRIKGNLELNVEDAGHHGQSPPSMLWTMLSGALSRQLKKTLEKQIGEAMLDAIRSSIAQTTGKKMAPRLGTGAANECA